MAEKLLKRLQNKKKMWVTPKHPLYFQSIEYKIIYSAAVFMHAGLHRNVNALNNFELERLLSKGFVLDEKEKTMIIRMSQDEKRMIDSILRILKTPLEKELFLMDLISVSMGSDTMSIEERESISFFAELLSVSEEKKKLLEQFVVHAFLNDKVRAMKTVATMEKVGMAVTRAELKYYMTELDYVKKAENTMFDESNVLYLIDQCAVKEDLVVKQGQTLLISNAQIDMYGTILLDGGTVQIQGSHFVKKSKNCNPMIQVKSYSKLDIVDSEFLCMNQCSAICQENGQLFLKDSVIKETLGGAVFFTGRKIQLDHVKFETCFSNGNGGAIYLGNGIGQIKNCEFRDCQGKRGGGIYGRDGIKMINCNFNFCKAVEYGGSIFYDGEIHDNIIGCHSVQCYPKGEEMIQCLNEPELKVIKGEYRIEWSTLLEQPILVEETGILVMEDALIYLNQPIKCKGFLQISNCKVRGLQILGRDMFLLERAKGAELLQSDFDGNLKYGIFYAEGTRIKMNGCVVRNTGDGRGIFNMYGSLVENSIFSFCQKGGIYCQGSTIRNCHFVNCRGKSGAGILAYGTNSIIENCSFIRCISNYSGGGIDATGRNVIKNCTFEECKPDNMS